MKKAFDKNSTVSIRPLGPDDIDAYKAFCTRLPDPERYRRYWENSGDRVFGDNSIYVIFGLWDNDQIIGQTLIAFDPDDRNAAAVFCESEIGPEYRGRGYADMLYESRLQYLKDIDFKGAVETHIKAENAPSLKAAQSNGFSLTGETHKGFCVLKTV